ncbi:MAG: tRNA (adenosine(37)-N6)-threonylcarbamoyltransferase complex dimerization subunit type 1 TsaB [Bacilli bacterium]|nr:tRNA (adenosine(37)-N6)-threonylcarbamoyltransferase complex dimerization subunit type 1 TsaB [Bacilli bacterium]
MRYLYIDTSSSFLYTAIVTDNSITAEIKKDYGQKLSEKALPEIVSMFESNSLSAKDIDKIIVVSGPGSFTGIRIGITIAKVYAWSLKIPITAISSIEAMMISSEANTYKVPMLDARRKYVYTGIYDKDNNVIHEPSYMKLEDINNELKELDNFTIISNDKIVGFDNIEKYDPNILKIVQTYKDRKNINPHAINPEYLKLTEAEESKL